MIKSPKLTMLAHSTNNQIHSNKSFCRLSLVCNMQKTCFLQEHWADFLLILMHPEQQQMSSSVNFSSFSPLISEGPRKEKKCQQPQKIRFFLIPFCSTINKIVEIMRFYYMYLGEKLFTKDEI